LAAQDVQGPVGSGLSDAINAVMAPVADVLNGFVFHEIPIGGTGVQWIAIWLVAVSLFLTLWLGFINISGIGHAIAMVRPRKESAAAGEVSPFKALATALSGIVGLGHIAGIAVAITIGGPGAAFWLVVMGFISMATKFAEAYLGVRYRIRLPDGRFSGGPTYYMAQGFAERGWPRTGKIMAIVTAIALVIASNTLFQINQAQKQFAVATGTNEPVLFGLVWIVLVGCVIIGELKSISAVVSRLVPFMCILYLGAGFVILAVNIAEVPEALALIVRTAFYPEGVAGGFLGCMVVGVRRAVFANSAGLGVTASAHASAQTDDPVKQGYVAMIEPLLSIILICATTALIVVVTGAYKVAGAEGIEITSIAYESVFPGFKIILTIAVMLFAFSTIIGCFYYGLKAWSYLFGAGWIASSIFKIIYLATLMIGSVMPLSKLIDLADAAQFLVAIPNIIALYIFAPEIRRALRAYQAKQKI
jgi:alanine or glycine:cation symporter, AGCS family